jgi:hypothetical protein
MEVINSWIWIPEKPKIRRAAGFTITEINIQFLESSLIEKNRIEQKNKKENKNHLQDTRS